MKKVNKCSFCGLPKEKVAILIEGQDGFICENCVEQAEKIIDEALFNKEQKFTYALPKNIKPIDIKNHLDQYVIGQDEAKKVLSVAVYNHYKRLNQKGDDEVEIEKSNILFVGETGTGKTLLAKSIAKFLNVPFAIVDATVFTEAGYVGEDIESILARLLQSCNQDIKAAERGIVYIDEIDKIARKGDNASLTRDVSGEGVQQGLLKLLEGSEVLVPPNGGRKHPDQKMLKVDTANILFICGGAFDGISNIISARMQMQSIGFNSGSRSMKINKDNYLQYISALDVRKFGLIPELIGRLPVICHLNPLDKEALLSILVNPKNAIIKQYKKLLSLEGIKLTFDENALNFIVEQAFEFKLGARGLRSICEAVMNDLMFDLPSTPNIKSFNVTEEYCRLKINKEKLDQLKAA